MDMHAGMMGFYTFGDGPLEGQTRPAVVVVAWSAECANIVVFLDGSNDGAEGCIAWKTSVSPSHFAEPYKMSRSAHPSQEELERRRVAKEEADAEAEEARQARLKELAELEAKRLAEVSARKEDAVAEEAPVAREKGEVEALKRPARSRA